MEDSDRQVENATQEVIQIIEKLTGESLDSYLNGSYDNQM